MFPDWWFHIGFTLLALAEIILIAGLFIGYRKSVRDCTKPHGSRWPNEPCGRSLDQCPYSKIEHLDYFNFQDPNQNPF
jgi:hypothetical protein